MSLTNQVPVLRTPQQLADQPHPRSECKSIGPLTMVRFYGALIYGTDEGLNLWCVSRPYFMVRIKALQCFMVRIKALQYFMVQIKALQYFMMRIKNSIYGVCQGPNSVVRIKALFYGTDQCLTL